jgi:hypothetical protein
MAKHCKLRTPMPNYSYTNPYVPFILAAVITVAMLQTRVEVCDRHDQSHIIISSVLDWGL